MLAYRDLTKEQLEEELLKQKEAYKEICAKNISLDMSRGKPAVNQLDMTMDYLDVVNSQSAMKAEDGMDVRNYGGLDGIPEAKKLIADILEVKPENVIVCGVSNRICFGFSTFGSLSDIPSLYVSRTCVCFRSVAYVSSVILLFVFCSLFVI